MQGRSIALAIALTLPTAAAAAYSVPAEHPRIFVTKETLPELAKRATGPFATDYAYVKSRADNAVRGGAKYINNRYAQPHDLLHLGVAYLVERELGKEHKKYADAAAREMKRWLKPKGGSTHFGWHAICYDWVYDGLSDTDKRDLGNRLGSWLTWYTGRAEIVLRSGHWEYNQTWCPTHMNTMHCRDGITPKTFIALAIHGAPTNHAGEAKQWLDSCDKRIPTECLRAFERMGGVWAESMGHGGYGPVTVPAWTFEAWHTGMGVDWYSKMKPWSYLPEETAWTTYTLFPHNDGTAYIDDNGRSGKPGAYIACAPMLARAFRDPVAVYWSNRAVKESWLRYNKAHWARLLCLPADVKPMSPSESNWPKAWFFRGAGHAYMRSAWDDPNATWAFFGAGPHMAGHQHDDEGHFLIARKGLLVSKGGGQGGGNDSDHYWGGSLVFNILTIFDRGEQFRRNRKNENDGGLKRFVYAGGGRYNERGHIVSYQHDDSRYTYAAADLTKGYTGKVREVVRHFLYLRGPQEFFVVFDRVEASNAQFPKHFMLHVPAEPKISGSEKVKVAGHVSDYSGDGIISAWESSTEKERDVRSQGKSRIFMKTLLPAGAVITKRGGQGHENWGHPCEPSAQYDHTGRGRDGPPVAPWRLEVAAPLGTPRQYFLHVFLVTDGSGPMPETSAAVSGSSVTVKIDGSPRKYEVTFALSGAASAKVSCKGQGAYDASLPARIEVPAQAAVEEARAKGAVARRPVRAARPSAAPGGEGGSGGAAPAGDRVAELYLKARGLEEANVLGAEALYRRILEDGKGTKHALMAADRLKAITPMVARAKEKQDAGASERKARRYFQLAENMLKAENYEVARAYYMRIIRDYPESGYAARARERLQDIR